MPSYLNEVNCSEPYPSVVLPALLYLVFGGQLY
jgi:hypothetical protein